jgi:hypothetical protein
MIKKDVQDVQDIFILYLAHPFLSCLVQQYELKLLSFVILCTT